MTEKISDIIMAAESNDADAQVTLYECVENRDLPEIDRRQILDWFLRTAKQGNAQSMYWLGCCYSEGIGVAKDEKRAFEWFVESAKAGFSIAFYYVGMHYKDGRVVAKDYGKAIAWFEDAIVKFDGDYDSERELGRDIGDVNERDLAWWEAVADRSPSEIRYPRVPAAVGDYYYCLRVQDLNRAFHYFKIAAELGYGYSQFMLGKFYFTGGCVERDHTTAFQWFEKAACQKVVPAMYYLGKLYADDQSAVFDMEKAVSWWMRSHVSGDCEAPGLVELELSWCFALGVGVDKVDLELDEDEDGATYFLFKTDENAPTKPPIVVDEDSWWFKYVKNEDLQALYWLGMCYTHVKNLVSSGECNKYVSALNSFLKAAEKGHAEAQNAVACFMYYGRPGAPCDQKEGLRWYRLAAAQGQPDAIEQLEEIERTYSKS